MEELIFDLEADGFLQEASKLHFIQVGTVTGTDVTVYGTLPGYSPISEGLARLKAARKLVGHGVIRYDCPLLDKLHPGTYRREQIIDTLTACRLLDPEQRQNSLKDLGERLGVSKGEFTGPWGEATEEMAIYARQDVVVGRAVWNHARVVETWGDSLQLELDTAWAIAAQERNGFCFDVKAAEVLEVELRHELELIKHDLRDVFPSWFVPADRVPFVPKRTDVKRGYVAGVPIVRKKLEVFNPASRKQVGVRLQGLGWKPKAFGADGSPTVDETVLAALPYPEAQRLVVYFEQLKKLGQLSDGKNGWLKLVKPDGRIYGAVNSNGACTGRMSHFAPNVAQVNKDPRMRSLWLPRPGWVLSGCDASGLEARMLAHFLARYDDGAFAEMLLNGKSEDGTDVHSANAKAVTDAGFKVDRNTAKTLLYALMYGAGDAKLGRTVSLKGSPAHTGAAVRKALAKSMKGIDKLTEAVKDRAKSVGYLTGLDGRHLVVRSEHSALNTLLQGAGAIVMKQSLKLHMERAPEHGVRWGMCANVHDEVVMECEPDIAASLGATFEWCIRQAGIDFKLRCPLAGTPKVGMSWQEIH